MGWVSEGHRFKPVLDHKVRSAQTTPYIILVQPNGTHKDQLSADIRAALPSCRLEHTLDLTGAFALSQKANPDLVVIGRLHADFTRLATFLSLLSALAVDWIILGHGTDGRFVAHQSRINRSTFSKLFNGCTPTCIPTLVAPSLSEFPMVQGVSSLGRKPSAPLSHSKTVVIGASTGGIEALFEILPHFPADTPPTVIVQHIHSNFLPGLADRLDRVCSAKIRLASSSETLETGLVLLAKGEETHTVFENAKRICQDPQGLPHNGHKPSIDALFSSAARHLGTRVVGVLLSGMGCDGALGLKEIHAAGGTTIVQDQDTCAVYGMPRAANRLDAVEQELPVSKIAQAILNSASRQIPGSGNG